MAQSFIVVLVLVDLLQRWRKILRQRQPDQDRPGLSRRSHGHKIFRVLINPFLWRLLKHFQVGKGLTQRRPRTRQIPACYCSVIADGHGESVLQRVLVTTEFMQHAAVVGGFKRMLNFGRLRYVHGGMAGAVAL